MTWHHVAALLIAGGIVITCGHSPTCSANMGQVLQLATAIVAGVFGHAGSSAFRRASAPAHAEPEKSHPTEIPR